MLQTIFAIWTSKRSSIHLDRIVFYSTSTRNLNDLFPGQIKVRVWLRWRLVLIEDTSLLQKKEKRLPLLFMILTRFGRKKCLAHQKFNPTNLLAWHSRLILSILYRKEEDLIGRCYTGLGRKLKLWLSRNLPIKWTLQYIRYSFFFCLLATDLRFVRIIAISLCKLR